MACYATWVVDYRATLAWLADANLDKCLNIFPLEVFIIGHKYIKYD